MQLFDTSTYDVPKGGLKTTFKTSKKLAESIRAALASLVWPDNYTIVDGVFPMKRCVNAIRQDDAFIFDVETSGLDPWKDRVVGMSIKAAGEVFILPIEHTLAKNVPHEVVRKGLGEAFRSASVRRSNHNIKFDMHFVSQTFGIEVGAAYLDTWLQSLVINPDNDQSHGLKELCAFYGLAPNTGNYTAQFGKHSWAYIEPKLACYYAGKDVDLVDLLANKQDEVLAPVPELVDLLWNVEMPMLNLTYRIERDGVLVDEEYMRKVLRPKVYTEWAKWVEELTPFIEPHLGYVEGESVQKVLESPSKLQKVFFDKLKLPKKKFATLKKEDNKQHPNYGKWTKLSLDKDAIAEFKGQYQYMAHLDHYRKWATVKKMFVDQLPGKIYEKRIHPTLNPIGAATGRMSCANPNLQQIPSKMGPLVRNMFVPAPDCVFMSADFSSQEMRILADASGDKGLERFFLDPTALDPYSETAIMVSKDDPAFDEAAFRALPKGERKGTPIYRDFKSLVLGLGFGMGPAKYARNTGKTKAEGQANFDKYHAAFPMVKKFQEKAAKFARKTGFITTKLRRRRPLKFINSDDDGLRSSAERAAANTPIQGTAADMVKMAALACDRLIAERRWPIRIVLIVHDEIIFEIPKAWLKANESAIVEIKTAMETALPLTVPMVCSAEFEERWGSSIDLDDLDDFMDDLDE